MKPKTKGNLFVTAQFALLAVIFLAPGHKTDVGLGMQIAVGIVGAVGWLILGISLFNLGRSLTANPVPLETATLKTGGLYAMVRHPIYLGLLLISLAGALNAGTALAWLAFAALVVLLVFKARFEEGFLLAKYPGYGQYAAKTGMLIPGLGKRK